MDHKIVQYDPKDKGSQFESEMKKQENPWNIFLSVNIADQLVLLLQDGGKIKMRFPHPEAMRIIAGFLNDYADKWERGELPGLKAPENKAAGGEAAP